MADEYVEFFHNEQNFKRYLEEGESKTKFICPKDFLPILNSKGIYSCVWCNRRYTSDELKNETQKMINELQRNKTSLEKSLKELNKK